MNVWQVAFIGYGEVGQTLAPAIRMSKDNSLVVWDKLFKEEVSTPLRAIKDQPTLKMADSMQEAVHDATLVISAVTADQCLDAALEASRCLPHNCIYLDLNSVSPATKSEAARMIESVGGRFVEAAVMSPIGPRGIDSPILLGGPHADAFVKTAEELGFTGATAFSSALGRASATKMCRSVVIKGLEALLTEAMLTARHHDVEKSVLESLSDLLPGHDWPVLSRYMISRSLLHGKRRADEMQEATRTVRDAGVDPIMSVASVDRQHWAAQHRSALAGTDLSELLDALRESSRSTCR